MEPGLVGIQTSDILILDLSLQTVRKLIFKPPNLVFCYSSPEKPIYWVT